jgi:hypothetical protein
LRFAAPWVLMMYNFFIVMEGVASLYELLQDVEKS